MNARRWLVMTLGPTTLAGVLLACTLTQSLDYLQKGDGDGGGVIVGPEGGDAVSNEAAAGGPTVLVPNLTKPGLLAQDAATLYWIADGKVLSVPKTGGAPKTLGTAPLSASLLAADSDPAGFVFMATGRDVVRLPKDGSGGGVIFAGDAAAPPAGALATDESALFVLQYDENGAEGSRILRMAKDGGGVVDFASDGGPMTLNLDPTSVVWLDSDPDNPAFHVQAKSAPGPTSTPLKLGSADNVPYSSTEVAVDATYIFWAADEGGAGAATIFRRERQGAGSVVAIGRGLADDIFEYIALDDTYVYALETTSSSLVRAPKSGSGDTVRLAAGLMTPSGLVVDATAIYVTVEATGSNGALLKLAK